MRLLELENTWDSQHCINARKCILNEAKPPKEYEFEKSRHEWLEHCNHYGDGGGNFDSGISFENYLICISQTNARTKSKEIH